MSAIEYDITEEKIFHQAVPATSGGKLFNLPQCQLKSNSKNKFYNLKWTAFNQVSSSPQNSFADFKVDKLEPYLYVSFVVQYTLKNNNVASKDYLPGPFHMDSVEILEQGQSVKTHKGLEIFLKNSMFYDQTNSFGNFLLTQAGITGTDVMSYNAIASGASKNYTYEIPNILVNMHPMKLKSEIVLRLNFAKYFSSNVNDETETVMSNLCIMVNAVRLSPKCINHLFRQSILNYRYQEAFVRQYNLAGGFTSGVELSVSVNNFNYFASSIMIWLSKKSSARNEQTLNYAINKIKLCNSNGDSLLNSQYPTTAWLQWVCNKYHFDESSFFNGATKIYMLTVSTDPWADIEQHGYNGAIPIYNEYNIVFEPGATLATDGVLNVVYFSPSIVEINSEGKLKIFQSASP